MSRAPRLDLEQLKIKRRQLYVLTGVTAAGFLGLVVACVLAVTCANTCSDSRSMDKNTKGLAIFGVGLWSALIGTITGYFANRVHSDIFYGGYTSVFCGNTQVAPEGVLPEAPEGGVSDTSESVHTPVVRV
ncbi:MAG: hypothetical protein P1U63_04890 [Coxiellaceae bacterium]|nr:hypothetical protein [Coxiellaceae bacterium]